MATAGNLLLNEVLKQTQLVPFPFSYKRNLRFSWIPGFFRFLNILIPAIQTSGPDVQLRWGIQKIRWSIGAWCTRIGNTASYKIRSILSKVQKLEVEALKFSMTKSRQNKMNSALCSFNVNTVWRIFPSNLWYKIKVAFYLWLHKTHCNCPHTNECSHLFPVQDSWIKLQTF